MKKPDRQDIIYGLKRLEHYIENISDECFDKVLMGLPLDTYFMVNDWGLKLSREQDFERRVNKIEIRVF